MPRTFGSAYDSDEGFLASPWKQLDDLCTINRENDPVALLNSISGEFAPDMELIFPKDWAWAALSVPRSTRQIWYAVLSGIPVLPYDCSPLRSNLLTIDTGLMLRLRFGEQAVPIGRLITRIERQPLSRAHYDQLARILVAHPTAIAWFDQPPGAIETVDLTDFVTDFPLDQGPS